jgi:hypothetical protein
VAGGLVISHVRGVDSIVRRRFSRTSFPMSSSTGHSRRSMCSGDRSLIKATGDRSARTLNCCS